MDMDRAAMSPMSLFGGSWGFGPLALIWTEQKMKRCTVHCVPYDVFTDVIMASLLPQLRSELLNRSCCVPVS